MIQQQRHSRFAPIGMFDSGIGGLTVMQKIIKHLPHEQIVYFGDTARLPYGDKNGETIMRYAIENTEFLMSQQIKLLVVACNTASVHSIEELRRMFAIPIVDVVEAGVKQVVFTTKSQRIAVLGTKATIGSGIYEIEIRKRLPQAVVTSIACPLFTTLVEENFGEHPAAKLIVKEYLAPLKNAEIDTLLLGCTHFPMLSPLIQEELPHVKLVDPATCCAFTVSSLLTNHQLEAHPSEDARPHQFFVSEDPDKFGAQALRFLGGSPAVQLLPTTVG